MNVSPRPFPARASWSAVALFSVALVACTLRGIASEAGASSGPQLTIQEPSYDFGKVPQGAALQHAFTITNTGHQPLAITAVKPSCGCTTTGDWPHQLAPGESGTIPLKLDTSHFAGPIHKTISVQTNDPAHHETLVELHAVVWTAISIANPVLIFPAIGDPMQSGTRSTTLRSEVDTPLTLTDLKCDNPLFVPVLKEVSPGKEYELTVTTKPPLPDGTQSARITMKSSIEKMPEVSVQAVVTVLPPIQIAPTEFAFTTEKLAAAEKRYAVVLNHRGLDLKVSDLSTNAPGVQLSSGPSNGGKQFTITLTFPAGFEIHDSDEYYLRGKTNQPSAPSFQIPIVYAGGR
jgi:hypothetical protein